MTEKTSVAISFEHMDKLEQIRETKGQASKQGAIQELVDNEISNLSKQDIRFYEPKNPYVLEQIKDILSTLKRKPSNVDALQIAKMIEDFCEENPQE